MASEISQMSDSSIVIIQGTVGLYTVATRCHTCFAVTLKYTEDSSLTEIRHSLELLSDYTISQLELINLFETSSKARTTSYVILPYGTQGDKSVTFFHAFHCTALYRNVGHQRGHVLLPGCSARVNTTKFRNRRGFVRTLTLTTILASYVSVIKKK